MNQYKIKLLRKEFPFLNRLFEHLPLEGVNEIKIRKGDKNLLNQKGYENSYSGGDCCDYTYYFAIVGNKVLKLQPAGHSATGNEWDCNTVGEELFANNIVPDFIIECIKNDTDANGNGEVTRFWTIYKMNKFNLSAYHQQKIDEVATKIKAEIAAACKE